MPFNKKKPFFFTTTQKTLFSCFLWNFPFPFVSSFLFCFIQHKKDKKKMHFFETPFLTPRQPAKTIFAPLHTICVFRYTKNTIKLAKNKQKQILDGFLTQPWPDFWLKKVKSWTDFWLYSIHIYIHIYIYTYISGIYIYIYMLWSYYLGQVWGVSKVIIWAKSMLLSGPSLFSHYKNRGFRRYCFCSVIILCVFFVSSYLLIFQK